MVLALHPHDLDPHPGPPRELQLLPQPQPSLLGWTGAGIVRERIRVENISLGRDLEPMLDFVVICTSRVSSWRVEAGHHPWTPAPTCSTWREKSLLKTIINVNALFHTFSFHAIQTP